MADACLDPCNNELLITAELIIIAEFIFLLKNIFKALMPSNIINNSLIKILKGASI